MTRKDLPERPNRTTDNSDTGDRSRATTEGGTSRRALLAALGAGGVGATVAGSYLGPLQAHGSDQGNDSPLGLVPDRLVTHRAVRDGNWANPAVWAGGVPGDEAYVRIDPDVTVTVASDLPARLKAVRVDGTLGFDPTVDTHLRVDTLVTTSGSALRIGTEAQPIRPDATAKITFADLGPIDEEWDPTRVSRGLIQFGELTVHGAETTAWTELERHPHAGDRTLTLPEAPTNWESGDRIVIPGVDPKKNQDEEVTIAATDGRRVRLDRSLAYDHLPPVSDLPAYALNLSRNVRFVSETAEVPRRGHIIILSSSSDVRFAGCYGLGRSDKSYPFTNPEHGTPPTDVAPNPKARYALHYHRTGISAEPPHRVEGCVVDGSPGWGIVNHHGHVDVVDSVTYDVFGAGFVTEAGNERGSFRRNFALRSEGSGELIDSRQFVPGGDGVGQIDDFGHGGHGFWLQGPAVEVVDNVAAGHRNFGFVYWNRPLVDRALGDDERIATRTGTVPNFPIEYVEDDRQQPLKDGASTGKGALGVPLEDGMVSSAYVTIRRFENNEAFASGGGIDVSRHQFRWVHGRVADYAVIDGFTAYGLGPIDRANGNLAGPHAGHDRGGNVGISLRFGGNVRVENARLVGQDDTGIGINRNGYMKGYLVENSEIRGFDVGVRGGEHLFTVVRDNLLDNDVNVDTWQKGNCATIVEGNEFDYRTAHVEHHLDYSDIKTGAVFGGGRFRGLAVNERTAYYEDQAPDHVPFPDEETLQNVTAGASEEVLEFIDAEDPTVIIGMTNRELKEQFDAPTRGALLPGDAIGEPWLTYALVEPAERVGAPTSVWLDATAGDIGHGFEVVPDANAGGKRALEVTAGLTEEPHEDSSAVTTLACELAAGTYTIHGRIWSTIGNGDSLWIRVDEGPWLMWSKLKSERGYLWFSAKRHHDDLPYEFDLSEGRHTIGFASPVGGLRIDKLLVAADETVVGARGHSADNV